MIILARKVALMQYDPSAMKLLLATYIPLVHISGA